MGRGLVSMKFKFEVITIELYNRLTQPGSCQRQKAILKVEHKRRS